MLDFQTMIAKLQAFWTRHGCVAAQPYDVEKGAGTMNPMTFLRVLTGDDWRVAYVEPSRRPADGRYGNNPNRLYQHHQFQVIVKPSPDDIQELYIASLEELGVAAVEHDIRFVEDNWEAPTLGAWGLGWEVWVDGMEVTQITYFQQVGGIDARPVAVEITYGLERLASYIQDVDSVYDLVYAPGVTYGDVFGRPEFEHSVYSFEVSSVDRLVRWFDEYEAEARLALDRKLAIPAYDYVLKCSHVFNLLDARGAVSVAQRTGYMARVRSLARLTAQVYVGEHARTDES